MPQLKFAAIACLTLVAVGCTALERDIEKGVRYDFNSARLTKKADSEREPGEPPKAVNAYLWRAAMDTIGFLPLESADPIYGRIVTQWYSEPNEPGARSKTTIEILDPDLRRDTIRVTVSRQVQDAKGQWYEAPVPAGSAQSLEDSIYVKARDISPY